MKFITVHEKRIEFARKYLKVNICVCLKRYNVKLVVSIAMKSANLPITK